MDCPVNSSSGSGWGFSLFFARAAGDARCPSQQPTRERGINEINPLAEESPWKMKEAVLRVAVTARSRLAFSVAQRQTYRQIGQVCLISLSHESSFFITELRATSEISLIGN